MRPLTISCCVEPELTPRLRSVASLVSAQVIRGVVIMQQGFSIGQNESWTHMPLSTWVSANIGSVHNC